jgi:hypothetical protein
MSSLRVTVSVALAVLLSAPMARAVGAIAYNQDTQKYARTFNYSTQSAASQAALSQCGYGCKVVLEFSETCGALAADGTRGSTLWATGHAELPDQAGQIAVNECMANKGGSCARRVFACDGKRYIVGGFVMASP